MPRKKRDFEKGNFYHIIKRGVEGRDIFLNKQDYERFILALEFFNSEQNICLWDIFCENTKKGVSKQSRKKLKEERELAIKMAIYRKRLRNCKGSKIVRLVAFTLMPNHYHLLLREIEKGGISLFMQKMGSYATYFNNQHKRNGTLFQSRYKSVLIEDDKQMSVAFSYIHTNPIELFDENWREGKIKNKKEARNYLYNYSHSSLLDYIGKRNHSSVTSRGFLLDMFGGTRGCKKIIENWIEVKSKK